MEDDYLQKQLSFFNYDIDYIRTLTHDQLIHHVFTFIYLRYKDNKQNDYVIVPEIANILRNIPPHLPYAKELSVLVTIINIPQLNIQYLPNNVIYKIMTQLIRHKTDLLNLSSVNKRFRNIAYDIPVYICQVFTDDAVIKSKFSLAGVNNFYLNNTDNIEHLYGKGITNVHWSVYDPIYITQYIQLFKTNPIKILLLKLKTDIDDNDFISIISSIRYIDQINIGCEYMTDSKLKIISDYHTKIKYITLSNIGSITLKGLDDFFSINNKIDGITFSHNKELNDNTLQIISKHNHRIRGLYLYSCPSITETGISYVAQTNNNIQYFKVHSVFSHSLRNDDIMIYELTKTNRNLKSIMFGFTNVTDIGLGHLAKTNSKIEELIIYVSKISLEGIVSVVKANKNIKKFKVNEAKANDKDTVTKLLKCFTKLTKFQLDDVRCIPDDVGYLVVNNPDLKFIEVKILEDHIGDKIYIDKLFTKYNGITTSIEWVW